MVRINRVLIGVAATALLVSGCTVKKTERPALAGPSEMALSINLSANPDILTQDGTSQSRIVILARDQDGLAIKGLPLHLGQSVTIPACSVTTVPVWCAGAIATAMQGELSTVDVVTGNDGRATLTYTAPPLPADSSNLGTIVTVTATPIGTDFANAIPRATNIGLVPPGVVPPGPVAAFTFTPAVVVTNATVTFDPSGSSCPGCTIVGYAWDFGDGSTGTGAAPQHVYRTAGSYTVVLIVYDDHGRASYACSQTVKVDKAEAPTAAFVFSPQAPITQQPIFFNAATSLAGAGRTIVRWDWDFGNGQTATGMTATSSYTAPGTYNVTLVVTDDVGQTASKSQSVTVTSGGPTASFAVTGTSNVAGPPSVVRVSVDGSGSTSPGGRTIVSYEWNWGDGTATTATTTATTTHDYTNPGVGLSASYTITLTVVDSAGSRASTTRSLTVTGF